MMLTPFYEPAKNPAHGGHWHTAFVGDRCPNSSLIDQRLAYVEDDAPDSLQHMLHHKIKLLDSPCWRQELINLVSKTTRICAALTGTKTVDTTCMSTRSCRAIKPEPMTLGAEAWLWPQHRAGNRRSR
jgi:hypothetical protein